MNNGIDAASTGLLARTQELDLAANNLANANTSSGAPPSTLPFAAKVGEQNIPPLQPFLVVNRREESRTAQIFYVAPKAIQPASFSMEALPPRYTYEHSANHPRQLAASPTVGTLPAKVPQEK
jgi:hypothetical protein